MGSIYTHLNNFVETWEGWAKLLNGLSTFSFSGLFAGLKYIFGYTQELLSSK
ncbi:hypothetical protein CIP101352_02009 [Corynebacterium diphtheriae]|nr:hypothetical protein CIP101352_02009 [Corynebacterium diphtheriae]